MQDAVASTAETTQQVKDGMPAVESAGVSFGKINEVVKGVADQIRLVSITVEELSAGSGQFVEAIQAIQEVATATDAWT